MQALVRPDTANKQKSRAVELLTSRLNGFDNKGQLIIKALLPGLPNFIRPFARPPPSIIRILLDSDQRIYFPGDRVSGVVRLIVAEPISLKHISITLGGRAYVKLYHATIENSRAIYTSDIKLFQTSVDIAPDKTVLGPKRYEWPFELDLPVECSAEAHQFNEHTRLFNHALHQPLPHTFHDKMPGAARNRCALNYEVNTIVVQKQHTPSEIKHSIPIILLRKDITASQPKTPVAQIIKRCTFSCRSTLLSVNTTIPPTPTLSSKLMGTLLPFTLPTHNFHLDARLPRAGHPAQITPITLSLTHSTPQNKLSASLPPVSLMSLSLTLIPHTFTRALPTDETTEQRYATASGSLHKHWQGRAILLADLERPILDMPEQLVLAECVDFKRKQVRKVASQFRSFNMARDYTLSLVCKLECGGEKCEGIFKVEGFQILEARGQERSEGENNTVAESAQEEEVVEHGEEDDDNDGVDDGERTDPGDEGVEPTLHQASQVAQTVPD